MDSNIISTPFGARPMSLALFSRQIQSNRISEKAKIDKWKLYRWLCEGKSFFKVSDRTLAVLNALLSFYPANELSADKSLVVFPSNKQLSLRAHGMADTTLRRHLASLLQCGLITRRDSPNGKRYAHKSKDGEIASAYGFSLAPLLARASEIEEAAEQIRTQQAANRLMRERLSLARRDIAKLIEMATEHGFDGRWEQFHNHFRDIISRIPRRAETDTLEALIQDLADLRAEIDKSLNLQLNEQKLDGNEAQNGWQHNNSKTESIIESEPLENRAQANPICEKKHLNSYPLAMVLNACSEIYEYSTSTIEHWRDFINLTAQIRLYLGISHDTYHQTIALIGHENTAITIACILQRHNYIQSAEAYMRKLSEKAANHEFTVGPMLMALVKPNQTASRYTG